MACSERTERARRHDQDALWIASTNLGADAACGGNRQALRSQNVRQRIGYMSQKFSLYDDLSIEENLEFFAGVYGVPRAERKARRQWALSFSGLEGKEKLVTGSLPWWLETARCPGAAIMHEPTILFSTNYIRCRSVGSPALSGESSIDSPTLERRSS